MANSIEDMLRHIVLLSRHLYKCDMRCAVYAVLMELHIPSKSAGFDYLANAILLHVKNPTGTMTKDVYPTVGKMYNPAVMSYVVERMIRVAITEAWKRRDDKIWECYFPGCSITECRRPTNAEFISQVARIMLIWQGCKEVAHANGLQVE